MTTPVVQARREAIVGEDMRADDGTGGSTRCLRQGAGGVVGGGGGVGGDRDLASIGRAEDDRWEYLQHRVHNSRLAA